MSLLVLMGSGETAPAMVRIHREVLERVAATQPVILDTPFGFQVNADQLVSRTTSYFKESVGVAVAVASWRSQDISETDKRKALATLARADWVFCGPGSPTYALSQWRGSEVPATLGDLLERGGALVLGSAAAVDRRQSCTAGLRDLQGRAVAAMGRRLEPHERPYRAQRGGNPPLQQRRGRNVRHTLLLSRRGTAQRRLRNSYPTL